MLKFITLILFIFSISVHADTEITLSQVGTSLQKDCFFAEKVLEIPPGQKSGLAPKEIVQALQCIEYVSGIVDGIAITHLLEVRSESGKPIATLCVPPIKLAQGIKIINTYLNDHPETLKLHRGILISNAFLESFPPEKMCNQAFYDLIRQSQKVVKIQ